MTLLSGTSLRSVKSHPDNGQKINLYIISILIIFVHKIYLFINLKYLHHVVKISFNRNKGSY